jgi:hypothetical protein
MPTRRVAILLLLSYCLFNANAAAAPKTGGTYRFPLATEPRLSIPRESPTPHRTQGTVLGFNLFGDGLRDLFDPRSRR